MSDRDPTAAVPTGPGWKPAAGGPRLLGDYIELDREVWVRSSAIVRLDRPTDMPEGCRAWVPGYTGPAGLPTGRENRGGVVFSVYTLPQVVTALAAVRWAAARRPSGRPAGDPPPPDSAQASPRKAQRTADGRRQRGGNDDGT